MSDRKLHWARVNIESIVRKEKSLVVTGWAASRDAGNLIGVEVTMPPTTHLEFTETVFLDSADVETDWPDLKAHGCRFLTRFRNPELETEEPLVVLVRPIFERGVGPVRGFGLNSVKLDKRHLARLGGSPNGGFEFLDLFIDHGGLQPNHRVVDLGCGPGRMAQALVPYLDEQGSYWGIDVEADTIKSLQKNLTERHPLFSFLHMDVANRSYNPSGELDGKEASIPLPSNSHDFAIAASLFTHLRERDARQMFSEAARILRPGGCLFASFFLDPNHPDRVGHSPYSGTPFQPLPDGLWALDPHHIERAVAHPWDKLRELSAGLAVETVLKGYWCASPEPWTYQDCVVFRKVTTGAA